MNAPTETSTARPAAGAPESLAPRTGDSSLRRRYQQYRQRQARELLALMPREAVRPLLKEARRRISESSAGVGSEDAVALLTAVCEDLLPLPPFEVWSVDFQRNRSAHLQAEALVDRGPVADGPVTVALRSVRAFGATWYASLDVRPHEGRWTGWLRYHAEAEPDRSFRTADVFREDDAEAVRRRFLEFDDATLVAFLRSVLP